MKSLRLALNSHMVFPYRTVSFKMTWMFVINWNCGDYIIQLSSQPGISWLQDAKFCFRYGEFHCKLRVKSLDAEGL